MPQYVISFICSESAGFIQIQFEVHHSLHALSSIAATQLVPVYGVNLPQALDFLLLLAELCEIALCATLNFPSFAFEAKLYTLVCQMPLLIWCHPQIC